MSVGLADDDYKQLPQHLITEISKHEPTSNVDGDTYHEVIFETGATTIQLAVVNGRYVAFPHPEQLITVLSVLTPKHQQHPEK